MPTSRFYLKLAGPLLFAFVLTLPLANRDIFSLFFNRLFPVRIVFVTLIALSTLFLLLSFLNSESRKVWVEGKLKLLQKDFVLKILLALWLVRLLSVKNSLNLKASFDLFLFYSSIIVLYLIFKYFFENQKQTLARLFNLHLIVVSAVVLYGFLQLILAFFGILLPGVLLGSTFVRIPATFYDSNHLPAYLLTAFSSLLIVTFYQKSEGRKFFLLILLGLYSLVTIFTFSRSGFLAFSLVVVFLSLVFLRKRYWRKLLLILGTVGLVVVVIYLTAQTQLSIFKRLSSVFNLEDKSTVAHGLLWYGGFQLFAKSPFIGLGYGSFSEHFRGSAIGFQHGLFDPATTVRIPAHSIWLEVLVETGFLGFVLYLWLMLTVLEKAARVLKVTVAPKHFLLQVSLLASFVGLMLSGLFYSYNLEFFWFFIFIVYFQSRSILETKTNLEGGDVTISVPEAPEKITVRPYLYLFCLLAILLSLVFSSLSFLPVLPGTEGWLAQVGKVMRIDWGYGVADWWVPRYLGQLVTAAPLPFFLTAFWTVLFDYGASVVRFFPALAGALAVVLFFFWQKGRRGPGFAFFTSLVLLAAPGVVASLRAGDLSGYLLFFNLAVIFLAWQIIEKKRIFLLWPLTIVLVLFSLTNYAAFLVNFIFLFVSFAFRTLKQKTSLWLLPLLLLCFVPLSLWFGRLLQIEKDLSLVKILSESLRGTGPWQIVYFLLLPWLAGRTAEFLYPRRRFWLWIVLLLSTVFGFYRYFEKPAHYELTSLILERLSLNRDGRIPLYVSVEPTEDLYYYAEVPLSRVSPQDLEERINSAEHFYAIVEGSLLKELKNRDVSNFFVMKVDKGWVLIEKPGQ